MEDLLQREKESGGEYLPASAATYSLRGLSVYMPRSAHERPDRGIFSTEFRFERGAASSAVIHTCISANDRQSAHGWLFASSVPDLHRDRPVAELAITSTGDVSLQAGCPTDYDALIDRVGPSLYRIEAPPSDMQRWFGQHGRWLLGSMVPIALLIAAAPSVIFFANRTSSERRQAYETATNAVPRLLFAQAPSLFGALAPRALREPDPAYREPYVVGAAAAASDHAARSTAMTPTATDAATGSTRDDEPASEKLGRSAPDAAAARESKTTGPKRAPHSAVASRATRSPKAVAPKEVLAQRSTSETSGEGATGVLEPAVEEARATPRERLALNTTGAERLMARQQDQCAQDGFFAREICKERLRWSHCHPDKWDRVPECRVQHFAPSQ